MKNLNSRIEKIESLLFSKSSNEKPCLWVVVYPGENLKEKKLQALKSFNEQENKNLGLSDVNFLIFKVDYVEQKKVR